MALFQSILDLLFPPRCVFCGALTDKTLSAPCPKCQDGPLWLTGAEAVLSGKQFSRCVCAGWYEGALRQSIRQFKFLNHPEYAQSYGPVLAKIIRFYLPGSYDVISWMPVSPGRLEERGYDQARLLAEETAAALGTCAVPLLQKTSDTRAQSSLQTGGERWKNVAGVYSVLQPEQVAGKRILLIDDIITSGATLEEGAKVLRMAGAAQVVAATFCRTPPRDRKTQNATQHP